MSRAKLVEGSIPRALASLALPTLLGIVFIIVVDVVDTLFVGQLGTHELAAMSFTFPVISLVLSVAFGLSIGSTSAVSRAIGGGDERATRRLTTHALMLAAIFVAAISGLGLLTQDAVFRTLGAEEAVLPLLDEYMTIWYAGAVFLVVPIVGTGAIRANGDARTPAVIMAVAALTNAVLDPMFIFGFGSIPAMGIKGAAIATLISRAVTLVASVWVLRRANLLDLHVPSKEELLGSWKAILSVGVPAALSNMVVPIAVSILTWLIATHGSQAVAGYGVASRLEGFLLIPASALSIALTPFIGQNWGGHHPERVAEALRLSTRFVLAWGLAAWGILLLFGRTIAGWFADDPAVIDSTQTYVWLVPASYGAFGLVYVVSSAFNAVDRAVRSTVLSAVRSVGLAVPLAFLGSWLAGLWGIYAGIATATLTSGAIAFWWSRSLRKVQAPVDAPMEELRGGGDRRPALTELLERAKALGDLTVAPRPINTIGFYLGNHELGHVHRTGHIDLHVPLEVHDRLIVEGRATHHRYVHEASWVTHRVDTEADVEEAIWLLRLSIAMHALAWSREEDPEVALDALEPSKELLRVVTHCADRAQRHNAA